MYRLSGSVGEGGRNAHDDVLLVQKQLNKNAHLAPEIGEVPESGALDEATARAILAFQRRIVRLSSPDGRVDPRGRTWRALLGDQPHGAPVVFAQLMPTDANLYLYENADRCWGTPTALNSVRRLADALSRLEIELGVGDISFPCGGRMPPHASHRRGVDVDLRPQRSDRARAPVTIHDPHYSRARTRQVVELLSRDDNLKMILFNDGEIRGVRPWLGHDNHLHVRFKE